ncbi:hypothetical protein GCM10027048_44710 [Hymenobacter coalescens]
MHKLPVYGENGPLKARFGSGQPVRLRYQGQHLFVPTGDDDDPLIFSPAEGPARALTIRESRWKVTVATRKP